MRYRFSPYLVILLICSVFPAIGFVATKTLNPVEEALASTVGSAIPEYDRSEWGRWVDADGDCQDTRDEVLIRESRIPVEFETPYECEVASGLWICPYTGLTFTNPSGLDIDHVVALQEAHLGGGWAWSEDEKHGYFNDLDNTDHLQAVSASANRSKGARGPELWLPQKDVCGYLKARIEVLDKYGLFYDCGTYLRLMVRYCS